MQPHAYMADSEDIRRLMNQRRARVANNYNMKIHDTIAGPVKAVTDRIVDEILYEFRSRLSAEIINVVTIELSKLLDVAEPKVEQSDVQMTPLYDDNREDNRMPDTMLPDWWSQRLTKETQNVVNVVNVVNGIPTLKPAESNDVITFTRSQNRVAKSEVTETTPLMYSSADLLN
jgi:hypothetical protein